MSVKSIVPSNESTVKQILNALTEALSSKGTDTQPIDTLVDGLVTLQLRKHGVDTSNPEVFQGTKDYIISIFLGRLADTSSSAMRKRVIHAFRNGTWMHTRLPSMYINSGESTEVQFEDFEEWLTSVIENSGMKYHEELILRMLLTEQMGVTWLLGAIVQNKVPGVTLDNLAEAEQGKLRETLRAARRLEKPDMAKMTPLLQSTVNPDVQVRDHVRTVYQTIPKTGGNAKKAIAGMSLPIPIGNGTAYIIVPRNEKEDERIIKMLGAAVDFKEVTVGDVYEELGYRTPADLTPDGESKLDLSGYLSSLNEN